MGMSKERKEQIGFNHMRAMLMRVWIGDMIHDLKAGHVDKVIAELEAGASALDDDVELDDG